LPWVPSDIAALWHGRETMLKQLKQTETFDNLLWTLTAFPHGDSVALFYPATLTVCLPPVRVKHHRIINVGLIIRSLESQTSTIRTLKA